MVLKIAESARVVDIGSSPTWYASHLRSVALEEASSRCRCPDVFSFVLRYFALSWSFRSSASLHTKFNMSVTPPCIGGY